LKQPVEERLEFVRSVAAMAAWQKRDLKGTVPAALTMRGDGPHGAAMPEARPALNRTLLLKLAAVAVVALGAALLVWWGFDLKALFLQVMAGIRDAGPWVFFTAMALLPTVGFPILGFSIPAGPVFGERMGLGGVLAAYGTALAINLALTYWVARFGLRPLVERLVTRAGYKIPQFDPREQRELTLLLRITVGPPFFVQNYLLGLGEVAFFTYMWISWLVGMIYAVGIIKFGDALAHGQARMAVLGLSVFMAVVIALHLVRRHYGKRRKQSVH
jgi:uncharacterized membrane protein YdjX (TVP38/TMEM64 family)